MTDISKMNCWEREKREEIFQLANDWNFFVDYYELDWFINDTNYSEWIYFLYETTTIKNSRYQQRVNWITVPVHQKEGVYDKNNKRINNVNNYIDNWYEKELPEEDLVLNEVTVDKYLEGEQLTMEFCERWKEFLYDSDSEFCDKLNYSDIMNYVYKIIPTTVENLAAIDNTGREENAVYFSELTAERQEEEENKEKGWLKCN